MYGIEPEVVWLATSNDRLSASVQYLNATYDAFVYTSPAPGPTGGCPSTGPVAGRFSIDCSGYDVPNAPEWTANAAYNRTFDLPNVDELVSDLSGHYRASTVSGEEQLPVERNDAYTTFDFTLSYKNLNGKWTLQGYVYNLTDKNSTSSSFFYGGTPTGVAPVGAITLQNAPRTFGARLNLSF
jgi:iron complex outermembrane receptor protein